MPDIKEYIQNLKEEILKDREALSNIVSNLEVSNAYFNQNKVNPNDNIEKAQAQAVKRLFDLESFIEADMKRLMS